MAKKVETFVTTRNLALSVRGEGNRLQTLHIQSGTTFQYSSDDKGYIVPEPRTPDEELVIVDESTYNSWRELKSIVTPELKKELESVTGNSNVILEQKVIDLTAKVSELEETIEDLQEELARKESTIKTLTNGLTADNTLSTQTGGDEDDDEEDDKELEVLGAGLPEDTLNTNENGTSTDAKKAAEAKKAAVAKK